jgi:hypothetical protein
MYPKGIIYENTTKRHTGEVQLRASLTVRTLYGLARGMGAGLVGFLVIAFLFAFFPIVKQELSYEVESRLGGYGYQGGDTAPLISGTDDKRVESVSSQKTVSSPKEDSALVKIAQAQETVSVQKEAGQLGVDSKNRSIIKYNCKR